MSFDSFRRGRNRVWLAIAAGMLLLGLNKQLDLHDRLKDVAKLMASQTGLLAYWRPVLAVFGVITVALSAFAVSRIFFVARRQPREVRWALAGSLVVLAFVVMRVTAFVHLGMPNLGENFNGFMELGGVLCVAGGAWRWRGRRALP